MKKDLEILLNLLNDIEVRGKRSLNNILLAIQIVEKLLTTPIEEE